MPDFAPQTPIPAGNGIAAQMRREVRAKIVAWGEYVTLERRNDDGSHNPYTTRLKCLPQPVSLDSGTLQLEGIVNISEANPHEFVFEGGVDVRWATDKIIYNGYVWRILNTNDIRAAGGNVALHAYAVIEGVPGETDAGNRPLSDGILLPGHIPI